MAELFTGFVSNIAQWLPTKKEVETVIVEVQKDMQLTNLPGGKFVKLAGLSGGLAVIMSAYGAHAFNSSCENPKMKAIFESGSKMHLIHSVALLGVPLTRRPNLVGSLMVTGMVIFSGTCYYQAITEDGRVRKATPYGGMLLILSWFAMML
ncbi:hypothetical protein ACF0H5_020738 [Mactra antiquata]